MMLSLSRQQEVTAWYRSDSGRNGADIAREAYIAARQYFEKELTRDEKKREWFRSHATLDEAMEVVDKAKHIYTQTSGKEGRAHHAIHAFASRVTYYGGVLDVLAQHHPEYVALAWGAVKFLLIGVLNHSELVAELADALTKIGDVLKQVRHEMNLYPTDHMLDAVGRLYGHIMQFLVLASRWYTMNVAKRAFSSIVNPFELRYQPVIEDIQKSFQNVLNIAGGACRAETRDLSVSVQNVEINMARIDDNISQLYQLLKDVPSVTSRILDISTAINSRTLRLEYDRVLTLTQPKRLPEEVLAACRMAARHRALWSLQSDDFTNFMRNLGHWDDVNGSALFTLRAGTQAEQRTKDFIVEVVAKFAGTKFTQPCSVLWYLSEKSAGRSASNDLSKVLKSLVHDLLRQNPDWCTEEPDKLQATRFHSDPSEQEWLDLLLMLLRKVQMCYIVMETEAIYNAVGKDAGWSQRLLDVFHSIIHNAKGAGNTVKVLLVTYADCGHSDSSSSVGNALDSNQIFSAYIKSPNAVPMTKKRRLVAIAAAGRQGGLAKQIKLRHAV